jgi:DNA polymerase III subunit gamma/tau
MSYLVLARKYRPQTFADIIGQEHITRAICNALVRDRVPHAILFTGSRGVGKTSSARVIAKALNCTGRVIPAAEEVKKNPELLLGLEPCGNCPNCLEITRGTSMSVFEMDGASNNSVDDVRQLIDTLYNAPPPGVAYKIYIIDEVHMLSTAAFNALLKSLEEPPKNTLFIFATTEPHKIPDTVISRCQQHDFRRIPVSTLVRQLRNIAGQEGFEIDDAILSLIAKRADGGMRDATTLLDRVTASAADEITFDSVRKVLGAFDASHFVRITECMLRGDSASALEMIAEAFSSSIDVKSYVSDFIHYIRLAALYSLARRRGEKARQRFLEVEEVSDVELELLDGLVSEFSSELVSVVFDHGRQIADDAVTSEYPRYVLEAGVIKLSRVTSLLPVPEVLSQLKQILETNTLEFSATEMHTDKKKKANE